MTDDILRDEPILMGRRLDRKFKSKDRRISKSRQMDTTLSTPKKPRTSEDFYLFCKFILEYENYDVSDKEESQNELNNQDSALITPEDSLKSSDSDEPHSSAAEMSSSSSSDDEDEDDNDLITCFCGKPFAGRPMIECSKCLTWIHLRCAKVKKSDIPDIFICSHCKEKH